MLLAAFLLSPGRSKKSSTAKKTDGSTFAERLAYRIDNFFSTKAYAPAALLLVITIFLVVAGGVSLWLTDDDDSALASRMWMAWRFVTDGGDYDEEVAPRVVGVVLVLSGMLFFALLVGLIGESIQSRLDDLKQGRNRVIETGHTLVLGWSDKLVPLAQEIAKANASEGGGVIVVLDNTHEKEWMDETVAEELPDEEMEGTQVVCRQGDPVGLLDLRKVSAGDARAIVVLADYSVDADMSDARAVRCVLALRAGIKASGHTVVELRDIDNRPTLELVERLGGDGEDPHGAEENGNGVDNHEEEDEKPVVRTLVPHDIIGRLMIQCTRQAHLAEVYDVLCGFDQMEFYFKQWPAVTGLTWGEVAFAFPDACPIGVRRPKASYPTVQEGTTEACKKKEAATYANPRWGGILLNPDDSYVIQDGDEILVVAEDDDTYEAVAPDRPAAGELPDWSPPAKQNENVLLLGWRRDLYDMLQELDKYVSKGCVVTVLAPTPVDGRQELLEEGKAGPLILSNIVLEHVCGLTTYRRDIDAVMRSRAFSSVLVLASEGGGGNSGADKDAASSSSAEDSRALTSLLLVRDIRNALMRNNGGRTSPAVTQPEDFTLLGEILDTETKDLVTTAGVSDYIMSNRLMAKVMAMVAEAHSAGPLFEQLFAEEGDEIYVREVLCYCRPGETLSFWQLAARARVKGDVAIGYKRGDEEVMLNPSNKTKKLAWSEGDHLVVIGDDGD